METRARAWSERSLRTLAMFGLTVGDVGLDDGGAERRGARAASLAARIDGALAVGRVCVMTGPSGAGKSTVLRALDERARARGERVVRVELAARELRRRVIDVVKCGGGVEESLRVLAACGLGDARLAVTPVAGLSEGERARLGLARALIACAGSGRVLLLADEFGAALDGVTARAVARGLSRFVRGDGRVRAVVVAGRDEVVEEMRAGVVARVRSGWIHG